jgi:hypothetical protein
MALRPFNSVAGITVGSDPQTTVILANGDITTTNLTANGVSNLGNIGNVKITGGNIYQVIATVDNTGAGNLAWATLTFMEAAGANTEVQYNNNGNLGASPAFTFDSANTLLTANNFVVTSTANLGNIGNVIITGGSSGQVIQTDGLGNLIFADSTGSNSAAPMPSYIPVGESYLVPSNFQGLFTVPIEIDGELQVDGILAEVGTPINSESGQIIFDDNGELTGNSGFSFDQTSGNLSVPGSGLFTGNLLPSANVTYDLGSSTQRWKDLYLANNTIYLGNSTISGANGNIELTNSGGGTFTVAGNSTVSTLENGNSSVSINANANITVSVTGTSNVVVFTPNTISVTGNVVTTGIKTDNYYYANGQPLDVGGNPAGSNTQIQFNNSNEFGASANLTFNSSTNLLTVTGNISANNANLGNAATANYLFATEGSLTLANGVIAVSGTTGGIFSSTLTDLNIGLVANIVMGSSTGNVTVQGNLKSNGGVTGTTLTGTLTTNAQPNVTSVGTLSNLTVSGNINTGNITVTNTVDAVNIKVTDLFSKRTSINITANTVIDTFPIAEFRSAKYTMRAGDGFDYQALEVLLVHNNINSIITVYGSLSTSNTDLVIFTTDISAGNVNVYATAVGPNTDLNLMGTYVPD